MWFDLCPLCWTARRITKRPKPQGATSRKEGDRGITALKFRVTGLVPLEWPLYSQPFAPQTCMTPPQILRHTSRDPDFLLPTSSSIGLYGVRPISLLAIHTTQHFHRALLFCYISPFHPASNSLPLTLSPAHAAFVIAPARGQGQLSLPPLPTPTVNSCILKFRRYAFI